MSQKPRVAGGRRRNPRKKLSENSKAGLTKVGEVVSVETLEHCLEDFDIQVKKMIKQFSQSFQKEAKKCLKHIPTKASLPGVVSKMSLEEFRKRGNSVEAVLKSLEREKLEEDQAVDTAEASSLATHKNVDPIEAPASVDLVTPALNTRSRRTVTTATTARKPRPLEELRVRVQSKTTGSPVDETALLEAHVNSCLDGMSTRVMDRLVSELPQCHRRKVMRAIREIKAEMISTGKDITKTPALFR